MKTFKLLLCAMCLFAFSSCGAIISNGPEDSVKTLLDKIVEINKEQKVMMAMAMSGKNFDQEAWVKLNTDAMTMYKSLHCHQGVATGDNNSRSVERAISRTILNASKMNEYKIENVAIQDDKITAIVEVSHDGGSNLYFLLKSIDEQWLIELNDDEELNKLLK